MYNLLYLETISSTWCWLSKITKAITDGYSSCLLNILLVCFLFSNWCFGSLLILIFQLWFLISGFISLILGWILFDSNFEDYFSFILVYLFLQVSYVLEIKQWVEIITGQVATHHIIAQGRNMFFDILRIGDGFRKISHHNGVIWGFQNFLFVYLVDLNTLYYFWCFTFITTIVNIRAKMAVISNKEAV